MLQFQSLEEFIIIQFIVVPIFMSVDNLWWNFLGAAATLASLVKISDLEDEMKTEK